jgi:hypothetical protein
MNPSEELRRHAVECGQMATFLRNKENSAAWNTIAERYLRCAQWYDSQTLHGGSPEGAEATKGLAPSFGRRS